MKYLLIILFFFFISPCWAETVTDGTSAGFVTVAPSANPGGVGLILDGNVYTTRFTSPVGANSITSMGWWCDDTDTSSDFHIGIYTHDSGNDRPDVLLASGTGVSGATSGWKTANVAYGLTASTTYWLAVQLDAIGGGRITDSNNNASYKQDYINTVTELPEPWGVSDGTATRVTAVYALYSTTVTAKPQLIFITEN